jgi:cytochrome c
MIFLIVSTILCFGGYRMNGVKTVTVVIFMLIFGVGAALAVQQDASLEKGKALFNDPKLGTTGKSCNDCHVNGKGADKAASRDDAYIKRVINGCITQSIKGAPLESNSVEMQSMVLYIKSLANKPAAKPRRAPVGC